MSDEEYAYEVIENLADAYQCAQLLADEFSAHNSIALFDRVSSRCFFYMRSWPLIMDSVNEKLSLLVRHRPSNKIVGAVIANDLYTSYKSRLHDISLAITILPINDLLAELNDITIRRDLNEKLRPNQILHLTIGATLAEHSGKGVASKLRFAACENAYRTKGFQYALLQTTNPVTKHIYANKMKGKIITTIDPKTWIWKNKGDGTSKPYENYKGDLISNIMVDLPFHEEQRRITPVVSHSFTTFQ